MIKRTEKLVITFHSTTAAMAMEHVCKEEKVDGRIIPVPGNISADCGLAWCADISKEAELLEVIRTHNIQYQEFCRCLV